jgi:hypothetical protein
MQLKEAEGRIEDWIRSGDWVEAQVRISLQLLASESQHQINHFSPHVDIIGELFWDYETYSSAIRTYWEISENQVVRLKALLNCFNALDDPASNDFWTVEALSSDPRWEEVRNLAKQALTAFNWTIEVPTPEKDSIAWKLINTET